MILHSKLKTAIKYGSLDISETSKTDVASFKKLDTHQILRFYYQLALGKGCCLSIQTTRNQSKIEVSFWIFNFQIKHFVLITDLFQLIHILDLYFTLHTHHLSPNHLICNRIRGHTIAIHLNLLHPLPALSPK